MGYVHMLCEKCNLPVYIGTIVNNDKIYHMRNDQSHGSHDKNIGRHGDLDDMSTVIHDRVLKYLGNQRL